MDQSSNASSTDSGASSALNPQPVNSHCPWSGDPVSDTAATTYRGHTVAFCNPGCRDKFEAATRLFDAAIDGTV